MISNSQPLDEIGSWAEETKSTKPTTSESKREKRVHWDESIPEKLEGIPEKIKSNGTKKKFTKHRKTASEMKEDRIYCEEKKLWMLLQMCLDKFDYLEGYWKYIDEDVLRELLEYEDYFVLRWILVNQKLRPFEFMAKNFPELMEEMISFNNYHSLSLFVQGLEYLQQNQKYDPSTTSTMLNIMSQLDNDCLKILKKFPYFENSIEPSLREREICEKKHNSKKDGLFTF